MALARVVIAPEAVAELERLIRTHSLPPNTKDRVRRSLHALSRFPLLGTEIECGRWSGYRFVLGPWRWLIILYRFDAESDTVMIASFEDGRSSEAVSQSR